MELEEYLSKYDDNGRELMDSTPVAATLRVAPVSEYQRLRAMIQNEMSEAAAGRGFETMAEAEDFDVGDDYDPTTPFEEQFDPDTGESMWDRHFFQEVPQKLQEEAIAREIGGDGGRGPHVDKTPPEDGLEVKK